MAVYLVKVPDGSERLVEAANKASARNHVARSCLDVDVAKQADLFRVAKAGGDIETAGAEAAAEPEAEPEADQQQAEGDKPASDTPPNDDPPEEGRKRKAAGATE